MMLPAVECRQHQKKLVGVYKTLFKLPGFCNDDNQVTRTYTCHNRTEGDFTSTVITTKSTGRHINRTAKKKSNYKLAGDKSLTAYQI